MVATLSDTRTDAEILEDAFRDGSRLAVTLTAGDLKRALALAKPAVANRTGAHPITFNVRLDTTGGAGGTLRITATDLELTATVEVEANHVTGRGTVLVNPKALGDALKGVKPRDMVRLAETADALEVIRPDGGRRTCELRDIDEWPRMATLEPLGDPLRLAPAAWARLCTASSTDYNRPPLTGIMVDGRTLVSTDSYRLHTLDTDAPFSALIGARAIRAGIKSKSPFEVWVTGEGTKRTVVVGCAEVTYLGRLIDCDFPNWRQLVPTGYPHELEVDGRELARVLRTFPDDGTTSAAVRLSCAKATVGAEVRIEQRSPGLSTATVAVDGCRYWPVELTLAFNRSFLADLVDVDGTVTLGAVDHLKPITAHDANGRLIGMSMPVRVSS